MKTHQVLALVVMTSLGFAACEDVLSDRVDKTVFLAALPERTLTIELPANGTVSPVGTQKVKDGEPLNLQAAPASGFVFYHWEKISGTGTVVFEDDAKPSTTARLSGGDAVVRAVFADTVFTVTVDHQAGGTTDRAAVPNLPQGVASSVITATADPDDHFVNWTVTAGTGLTFAPSANAAAVTVTATSSDASIRANFARNTYAYSFDNSLPGVWASLTGAPASLNSGQTYPVSALVYDTFVFDGWVKASGTGTATFASPASVSTSVTVTAPWAAAAAIQLRAKVRKEVLTLTAAGSLASPDQTTYPADLAGAWYDAANKALFAAGTGTAGNGTIRRFDLSSPNSVTTGDDDYRYLAGVPSALTGEGTDLYYSTSSQVGRLSLTGFGSTSTLTTRAVTGVLDLSLDPYTASLAVVRSTTGNVSELTKSTLADYTTTASTLSGWSAYRVAANTYGFYTVFQKNGANTLQGIDVVSGATTNGTPHTGADMNPGWVGKPAFNEDNEYFALPVKAGNGTWSVQIYDGTVASSVTAPVSSVTVGASSAGGIRSLSWIGSYIVAAGNNGTEATLWIIDAYDLVHPAVRKTQPVTGFTDAPFGFYDGTTFWVVADTATARVKIQGYSVTRS